MISWLCHIKTTVEAGCILAFSGPALGQMAVEGRSAIIIQITEAVYVVMCPKRPD
ncbi:hypothetical protein AG1IA_08003 [Rhizoctonia solani AG-1 IA]|uniref:Uncharacterized protein n=1 Tax=Thanatephorus cucumeris (strain AG1-IA) TaxID=983506 RepID=L8WIC0_THACA|nr:hypothetical protein AG1IA_08003 [Rhizoctonia solani AG-1 IA]